MDTLTVICSTRKIDVGYTHHVKKYFSHPKNEYFFVENDGSKDLTTLYNEYLNKSTNDVVVFIHDDLEFITKNLTPKIIKLFNNNEEYGIIGLAGTDNLLSGMWWEDRNSMNGQVGHIQGKKRYISKYSKSFGDNLKETVIVDGLFMAVKKSKLKHNFNEDFKGFHFYDLPICLLNHLDGIKVGITTKIKLYHKSVGQVNNQWKKNKLFFEALYEKFLPIRVG